MPRRDPVDRILDIEDQEGIKPSDDPIFRQKQNPNPNQVSLYDPMGQENFAPATGDGK